MKDKKRVKVSTVIINIFLVILLICILIVCSIYTLNMAKNSGMISDKNKSSDIAKTKLTDEEALNIVKEKSSKAEELYVLKGSFKFSTDLLIVDDKQSYEITNYNEVLKSIFTENGIKEYEELIKNLVIKLDGKVYKLEENNTLKTATEYIKVSVENERIVYKVKVMEEEKEITLVNKDNLWLIDSYKVIK